MIKYVLENDYDIEIYDDREEAIKSYNLFFNRMTESEKKKLDYFRVYSIEAENEEQIENTADLMDLCVEVISKYK